MREIAENDYWSLIRDGNNEAFSKLYNEHADMLYKYGTRLVQDTLLVEESIQAVSRIVKKLRQQNSCGKAFGALTLFVLKVLNL